MNAKVLVPKRVAKAFDYHKESCVGMSQDSINLMFMAIPFSAVHGYAKVLRDFAEENPTMYINAIVYGYDPSSDMQEEFEEMIHTWLNKPYIGDEKQDVKNFARMITTYFAQNG